MPTYLAAGRGRGEVGRGEAGEEALPSELNDEEEAHIYHELHVEALPKEEEEEAPFTELNGE